ncbi:hypothetical protein [Clostridium sp.]|jgi:hypothetical protein|uniref:hypothetical protein n=1 Tax=Clostridium sp. TaxID=1506 RepID=UPI0039F4B2F4
MKSKALISTITAGVLLLSSSIALATTAEGMNKDAQIVEDVKLISAPAQKIEQSYFKSYTGIIKSIEDYRGIEDSKIVEVEDSQGKTANLIISKDTYIVNDNKLEIGAKITGYYDATRPMILIYPPQYPTEVVIIGDIKESVKVGLFDENLISVDNQLKIKVTNDVEVVTRDGEKYEGELKNKNLLVIYDIATKSIPAQTKPIKVVVLDKESEIDNNDAAKNKTMKDEEVVKLLLRMITTIIK